jgi:hypothetical protein
LLTFQWLLTVAACVAAVAAWLRAKRLGKRLERLAEAYWELRYDHGQLKARLARLDPEAARGAADPGAPPRGADAFIPLSSLKR